MAPLAGWAEAAAPDSGTTVAALVGVLGAAIGLVVPGYVLGRVAGRAGREPDATDQGMTVRLAADSVLVHVAMLPLTYLLADSVLRHGPADYGVQIFLWFVATCLALPTALGACGVWLMRREADSRAGRAAALLGFSPADRLVHAWSTMLSELPRHPEGLMARVVLRDGRAIGGYYTQWARASDDPARHDLYLETVYRPEPLSTLYPCSGGIWLNGDDIVSVEFFLVRERGASTKGKAMCDEQEPAEPTEPEGQEPPQPRFRAHTGPGHALKESARTEISESASVRPASPVPAPAPAEREEAGR